MAQGCCCPSAASCPVAGWSSGMGPGFQASHSCPWGVHSHLQLHGAPHAHSADIQMPASKYIWFLGVRCSFAESKKSPFPLTA